MERTGKKISAAENVKPGKEIMMLDEEQLDKVVGAGELQPDAVCPRCRHTGHIYDSFTQKMDNNGNLIDYRIVDCTCCWYHKEIPQYC
jgi:hypothetical protein